MRDIIKKICKYVVNNDYRFLINASKGKYDAYNDEEFLKRKYKACMAHELSLENPTTFNEKLQWLKLYNRKPEYTTMVDKYAVRKYIATKLGEKYLIPLLGVWDSPDEIDFGSLPNKFVLKCNHNSGLGMYICKDKSKMDVKKVKKELLKGLAQDYYLTGREWPYKNVPRKIIAEQFMENTAQLTLLGKVDGLPDYKFYCFNGVVKLVMINTDRNSDKPTKADYFDRDFKWLDFKWGYEHADICPHKPTKYKEMLHIAEKLSQGLPHVRVDLYECNGNIFFGELTFFDGSGFDRFEPPEWDETLGNWINLPDKKIEED